MADLSKCKLEVVNKYVQALVLPVPARAALAIKVAALENHMETVEVVAKCDQCGYESDTALPECPFCGDSGEVVREEDLAPAADDEPADDEPADDEPAADEPADEAPVKRGRKKATAKPAAKRARAKAPVVDEAPKRRGKPPKTVVVNGQELVKVERSKPELVETLPDKAVLNYSKPLVKRINAVKELHRAGVECGYDMGRELFEIYDKRLYLEVTHEGGKPVYTSWEQFCKSELGISPSWGLRLMDVASHYDKDKVLDIGVTKMHLILKVPESKREALIKDAKTMSRPYLADEVKRLSGEKTRETGRKGFKGKSAIPKSKKLLTVVRESDHFVIDLFKAGTNERATRLEDGIVGIEHSPNGLVTRYVILLGEDGGLSLAIETKREESAKAAE